LRGRPARCTCGPRKNMQGASVMNVVLDIPGQPQSETSPPATEALKRFVNDTSFKAFYGLSGGGYNLRYILLHRIVTTTSISVPPGLTKHISWRFLPGEDPFRAYG
jgi:hypothetical protein